MPVYPVYHRFTVIINVLLIQCMTNIANVLNTKRVNPLLIIQCIFTASSRVFFKCFCASDIKCPVMYEKVFTCTGEIDLDKVCCQLKDLEESEHENGKKRGKTVLGTTNRHVWLQWLRNKRGGRFVDWMFYSSFNISLIVKVMLLKSDTIEQIEK